MRRLSRARLLLALSLLTSVASACAECAWVFWEESTGPPLHEGSTRAVSAWNTRDACEQALTQKFGSDSDLYSTNTNTEVMIDHQAGQPRLWARTKKTVPAALKAAKIADFRFHDLRHTFASRLAMEGVDLLTIKELGGWKSLQMVQRYAHLSPSHRRSAIERLVRRETSAEPAKAVGAE
jgi:hypothetical protein